MGLPWVCLGKTMLLIFELVSVISNLMLSLLFHLGFCWLIWYQLKSTMILITTSAEMELPWVCLRKTILFLLALVFVNSKKMLSLFFQLGFCWMIWYQLKRSTPIPITTSAQIGLPWVCLRKTMLFLFELIVISKICYHYCFIIIVSYWILLIDLNRQNRYARVFLAWYWNFWIKIVSHVVQRAFLCLVQAFEVIPTKQQTFIFKRETELHTLTPRARI